MRLGILSAAVAAALSISAVSARAQVVSATTGVTSINAGAQGPAGVAGSSAALGQAVVAATISGTYAAVIPAAANIAHSLTPSADTVITPSGGTTGYCMHDTITINQPSPAFTVTVAANITRWGHTGLPITFPSLPGVWTIDYKTCDGGSTFEGNPS